MDDGTAEEMGDAVLKVRRVRDVFRDAGWPERFVASVPDVSLGEFIRQLECPGLMATPKSEPQRPQMPPQWSAWPVSESERALLRDPAANAAAALRYIRERYGEVSRAWETYRTEAWREYLGQPWPLSRPPASPHGDPMSRVI